MSCPKCTCMNCAHENRRREHSASLYAMIRRWEWNASPAEARAELQASRFTAAEAATAMRVTGFPYDQIEAVTG